MKGKDVDEITMATGSWGKIRAFATVKFSNGLQVNGIKLIQSQKGLFLGMPSIARKNKETEETEWKDCVYLEEQDKNVLLKLILDEYNTKTKGDSKTDTSSGEDHSSADYF